jgi:hypothetical protein
MKHNRQCTYNVTFRRVHATVVVVEKQWVLHIVSVFVALGIQYAMHMRRITLSPVDSPTLLNVSTSHKRFKKLN